MRTTSKGGIIVQLREDVEYYFAEFVRKGGEGGTPQIRNLFFADFFP